MHEQHLMKLAQIEERLNHVAMTLERVAVQTDGLHYVKDQVTQQAQEIHALRGQFLHARGAVFALSALVGLVASFVPEFFFKR